MGERFEVEVGPIAHGGHCVARLPEPESRVVFTRHALPGERVVLEITEGAEGDRFWRADAVEVLEAAPERVAAPCRYAGPGGCGGCDFQHVSLPQQRTLKRRVLVEQLTRLGGLDPDDPLLAGLVVEAVPGDHDGLGWRTRTRYVDLPDGGHGMRKHRSHDVVRVETCLIAAAEAQPGAPRSATSAMRREVTADGRTHAFAVAADGFWQVHPGAPTALVEAVLPGLDPRPGESALDLFAGVGLFARFLADVTGTGPVVVEGDREAADHARANLADIEGADVHRGDVATVLDALPADPVDLVVLDPPREGAKRAVVEQVAARSPRAVAYVACDPAALARDVALFADAGYRLASLRAFDLFPMTHHLEAVAVLVPEEGPAGSESPLER